MQIIGGFSLAGCRTTLTNLLIDGLPDAVGLGSTSSILRSKPLCCCCDRKCKLFGADSANRLRKHPDQWLDILTRGIVEALGVLPKVLFLCEGSGLEFDNISVIPDKILWIYRDLRSWSVSDAIWRSQKKRLEDDPAPVTLDQVSNSLSRAQRVINSHLAWIRSHDIVFATLNTDNLVSTPEQTMIAIAKWMGIEYSSACLSFWNIKHHKVGGRWNLDEHRRGSRFGNTIACDNKWVKFAPEGILNLSVPSIPLGSHNM